MGLNDKADAAMRRELAKAFPERAANDPGHDRLAEALSKPETDAEALSRLLRESDETTRLVESVSKPTHTGGDWVACSYKGGQAFRVECKSTGNDCEPIATCSGPDCRANARLIAAAPELLEACKALVAAQYNAKGISDYHAALDVAKDMARAAIAKAEGGAV